VSSELAAALGACRRAFVATAAFSGMSNLLMLTGALFMLEVYDRILPSPCSFWLRASTPPRA
jgi:ATP-binding cassette subfamily C protein